MGLSRRLFTKEFKLAAVRRLEQGVSIGEAARALEVNPNVLHSWRREFRTGPGNAFPGNGKQRWAEGRIAELERKIGQQALEIDFLKGVLAAHRGTADAAGIDWKSAVCRKVEEEVKANRGLTIERMVELGGVSRSGFYRFDGDAEPGPDPHMDLRDAIQRIALDWPCYGRPRITAELRRKGWTVNTKLVYRLMREDNLLCVRRRKFVVTTDSNHNRKVYPNLARDMVLTATDQLWRADITYIRLRDEFVYLAVILDAYSRRVIGWALDRNMEDELTLTASHGAVTPGRGTGAGPSFRSRITVRQQRLHRFAQNAPHRHQHVAQGQPVGQRVLRIVHENPEIRRGAAQRLPGPGRGSRVHRRVPGKGLQPEAAALGARLTAAGRVRGTA
jgi:transposase-like protein